VAAIEALGRSRDSRRIEPLLDAAESSDIELAKAALLALDGVRDPRVRSRLGAALDHGAWHMRRLAADSLGRFGGGPAVELLRARLGREHEPLVREAIERALGALGSPMSLRRPSTMFPKVSR
jgi:HEAT repeat protein